jgi:hypothetical protein
MKLFGWRVGASGAPAPAPASPSGPPSPRARLLGSEDPPTGAKNRFIEKCRGLARESRFGEFFADTMFHVERSSPNRPSVT